MWTFGKYGFTSAVAYDPKKDFAKDSPFRDLVKESDTHILVRARIKADLEDVRDRVLPSMKIVEQPSADYSFRAVIPRSLFKKYLALMVDAIDYDSHFKEVAEKHGKGVSGSSRHSAMMKVWSAMASLQPHTPYSGAWTSSYSSYGIGSAHTSKTPSTVVGNPSTAKTKAKTSTNGLPSPQATVEDFMKKYAETKGQISYRSGGGPLTGFKVGDKVEGYFGEGTVTAIENRGNKPDMVTVKPDAKSRKEATFLSNYLVPSGLPVYESPEPDEKTDSPHQTYTCDDLYDDLCANGDLSDNAFSPSELGLMDDDAFELLTRLQEKYGKDAVATRKEVTEIYHEIVWEGMDGAAKKMWVADGEEIPEKYTQEAVRIAVDMEKTSP